MGLLNLSMEDNNQSTTAQETEVVLYAKITNPDGLAAAVHVEHHEQAQIKTAKGSVRIRKIVVEGKEPVFEMTSKIKQKSGSVKSNIESTKRINEDVYNLFMVACENFMSKTRYVFNVETIRGKKGDLEFEIKAKGMNFEVDVFRNAQGKISNWCKIDLEVDKLKDILKENDINVSDIKLTARIGQLPFKPNNIVIDDGNDEDPNKKELITMLFSKEFLIPR